ncbi:hypothetical protein EGT74_26985 [Chitinophaga lutea]|uniref:Uncharacterized protein n=1 Tax=Chitinophaga lutea TaxID=2488634 RepID=A0A3N4PNU2_9BACT|nr:hypothetical protein EGT74_26985 [Chitinophaga lutea]
MKDLYVERSPFLSGRRLLKQPDAAIKEKKKPSRFNAFLDGLAKLVSLANKLKALWDLFF